jgi:transcriptional regulator with XRE-family HTH domain
MGASAVTPVSLRIAELRQLKGWSQSELARRSGVPQSTISRLELRQVGVVGLDVLEKLANALGVNAAVLIEHTPAPRPEKGRGRG